jgi:diaminohydroxyphosphoribosylaminopyrimidine deaminase/5-amino-6-(5-phosphoribosylamino)uracil reductase
MVGSLVVREGEVVGTGYHPRVGEDHAEVRAIREAREDARGATLYSSLEPCAHHGRTPPCVDRILSAGVRRLVACTRDPNPLVNGRGFSALREAGVEVEVGLLEEEAHRLNEGYFRFMESGQPFVTVKAAASLDGRIAAAGGRSQWISSPEARCEAMRLRARHDAVLVGLGTVLADDPLLSVREPANARPILRAVLDSRLRLPTSCRLLGSPDAGPVVVYHAAGAPEERASALTRAGAITVAAGGVDHVDLGAVLDDLGRREVLGVLVEGGGRVIGSFLQEQRADRLLLFLSPRLLGSQGVPLLDGRELSTLDEAIRLERMTTRRIGADIMVEGRPVAT